MTRILDNIESRLNAKTIHELRQVGRAVGVPRPADGKKERIISYILKIATGEEAPVAPAVRGARPKSDEYDRELVADIIRCRELSLADEGEAKSIEISVSSPHSKEDNLDTSVDGILEYDGENFMICGKSNIYVDKQFIERYRLRMGDLITGKSEREGADDSLRLAMVYSINGESPESRPIRPDFETLSFLYPEKRLVVKTAENGVLGKLVDLFAPIGAGQRVAVVGGRRTGKSTLLREITKGISINNPEVKIMYVAIDAMPEDTSNLREVFNGLDVFTSSFEAGAGAHIRTAKLALEYAKRQVELGKDVLLVLDDLTALTCAYNSGRTVLDELSLVALDNAKKFLSCARTAREGSLTILTALDSEGDKVDEMVYSRLKDLFNLKIALSNELAGRRIYPAIDLTATYSSCEERFLTAEERKYAGELRFKPFEEVLSSLGN